MVSQALKAVLFPGSTPAKQWPGKLWYWPGIPGGSEQ